ncbi:hypothetical protein QOZ80_2AG0129410 [Eleusine coracana subsp. coracana]|nr:hypothetical protein QOZ80_2AG0129410 [Eleusine coracana subsp. coracana]
MLLGLAPVRFAPPPPRASAAAGGALADGDQLSVLGTEADENDLPPPENMHKWRMVIAYDGTKFKGWQYQPSPPTIQCFLENALIRITKLDRKKLCLVGAGRTDTGVHAWGQVAHFTTPFAYHCLDGIHSAINGLLPHEIRNNYAFHSAYKLNPQAMQEAAKHFVGIHDFTSFANAVHNDRVRSPVKKITRFDVIEMGAILQLEVEGTGFLYRQVRNMVALLLQVGKEALPPDIVPMIIAARDRKELAKVALSAPPHGLYLMSVNYDKEILEPPEGSPPISFGRTHQLSKCKLTFY